MSRSRGLAAATLALSLTACGPEPVSTDERFLVSFDAHAWSGGALVLRSTAFQPGGELPRVTVGGTRLGVRPHGSNAVVAAVPDTNGLITLRISLASRGLEQAGVVRVHGFVDAGSGPEVDGRLLTWPPASPIPTALGYQRGRLVRLDFRFNTATIMAPDSGLTSRCLGGPMPSAANPALVVVSACGPMVAVPVRPGAAERDTGYAFQYDAAMHLGRGQWLVSTGVNQIGITFTGPVPPGYSTDEYRCEHPDGYVVSPRGDRVVPLYCGSPLGAPVFTPAPPGFAYYLGSDYGVADAAFSAEGDTLWALDDPASLIAADAATGRILARTSLRRTGGYGGIAVDPHGPWLYVAGWSDAYGPIVEVLDRNGLTPVATLRVPSTAPRPTWAYNTYTTFVPLFDAVARRLYVVLGDPFVLQFELMP